MFACIRRARSIHPRRAHHRTAVYLFKPRLGRMSPDMRRIARDVLILQESLALFIRYQLTVTAPLPEADTSARAAGRKRFDAFITQVGKQIAEGQRSLEPAEPSTAQGTDR